MSDTSSSTHPLLSVAHWNTNTITYSFYNDANSGPYYGPETGVSEISEKTKDNIKSILDTLETYLDVDFHEVPDTATDYGLLRYMVSDGPGYAYAYLPNGSNTNWGFEWDVVGDVHINQAYDTTGKNGFADDPGNHGYMTLIHEIGHALGLKHPNPYEKHDYGPFLPFDEDNTTNTVMSYNFAGKSAITPMIYDIEALQSIYGAREYNDDDTTYSFHSVHYYTDGSDDYGSTKEIKQTLWDSGGINTLDFSNLTDLDTGYHFDINQGGIITTHKAYNGSSYKARTDDSRKEYVTSTFGTAIALDTVFHNLINSNSDDHIIANSAANIFSGYEFGIKTGNDAIEGWDNQDTLDLSNYAFSSVTQIQSGDNLILGLGSDSSITVKDYYTVSESNRLNIIFEEDSPPPVLEKTIVPETITNISEVQYVQEEPQPTNNAPTDITLDGNSVNELSENGITIGTLSTIDPDSGDNHTYELLDNADGRFKIDGNRLKVKDGSLLNFDDKSSHDITIRTTDSGGESYDETFTIKVENDNFEPTDISLDRKSVNELSENGTLIGTLTTSDSDSGDTHKYKLLDDADGRFKIDGNRLKVKDGSLLNFDDKSSHGITIRTTDQGGKSYDQEFTINVINDNFEPTDISLDRKSVNEFTENGFTIGTLTTSDVDAGDIHTYELLDNAEGRFKIVGNQLKVKDGNLLDFDKNSSHDITIRTTDQGGESYDKIFTIQVENQNNAPTDITLDGNSINELSEKGTNIGTLTTSDVDAGETHTYELLDNAKGRFEIVGNQLKVKDGTFLHFDYKSSHDIKIRTTDQGGESYDKTFTIDVINQNNAPINIAIDQNSVNEFSYNGTTIATLSTQDVDWAETHTYELLDNAEGRFEIVGNQLKVKDGNLLDFDDKSSHDIKIRTTDSGGESYDKTFTIQVENQNNAPTDITLDGNSINELSENGITIGTLTTSDVDAGDTHTYKLFDDPEGRFEIVGNQLKVKDGSLLDFDKNSSHDIKIRTTDSGGESYEDKFTIKVLENQISTTDSGGESYDKTFTIEVPENQNSAPTDITLDGNNVKEFSDNGTTIATLSTEDVDWGDTHTYKLLDDAQGRFEIVEDQLKVKNGTLLDFDVNSSHPIKIRTTDSGGESYDKIFTIEVLNHDWESKSIKGDGDDNWLEGGHGDDKLWGDSNNDTLIGGSGDDNLSGGSGDDSLVGGSGNDSLKGTWGNDILDGGYNDDTLRGGQGDDSLFGGVGNDSIMGDVGNDSLEGSSGQDTLSGGSGDDIIDGGNQDDTLRGGKGNDTLKGSFGDDYLRADQGNDSLEGGSGNDYLIGGSGNDSLDGGSGNDTLKASSGKNHLSGGSGDDLLNGGREHDMLEGGSGNDSLIAGSGDDTLNGVGNDSRGNGEVDVLVGGGGLDTFLLGDYHGAFYQGRGDNDYAEIDDFDSQDIIQLYGVADQYDVLEGDNGLLGSTALYFEDDLIAVFKDASVSDVSSTMEFLS